MSILIDKCTKSIAWAAPALVASIFLSVPAAAFELADSVAGQFQRFCLTNAASIDEQVSIIDAASGWARAPLPNYGRYHKADKNFAWKGEIEGIPFVLTLSNRSKDKNLSTLCALHAEPFQPASNFHASFGQVMVEAGLKEDESFGSVLYGYRGKLSNGKRATARLSSDSVRRGMAMLSSNRLELSILY
jgi:hypothetical protein